MRRIALCLLLASVSATVAARNAGLADAGSGACPERTQATATRAPDRDPASMAVPVKKTKPNLRESSGSGDSDLRLPSPRWHRFLPGMFR